ncbi:MAG: hypothetical protein AAF632_27595 [Bacteroidota bacterium]
MKESDEFNDEDLSDILKAEVRILPNQRFEDQTMHLIRAEIAHRKAVKKQLITSLKLFAGALFVVILLVPFMLLSQTLGMYTNILAPLILFLTLLIGIMNTGNYRRLINKYT